MHRKITFPKRRASLAGSVNIRLLKTLPRRTRHPRSSLEIWSIMSLTALQPRSSLVLLLGFMKAGFSIIIKQYRQKPRTHYDLFRDRRYWHIAPDSRISYRTSAKLLATVSLRDTPETCPTAGGSASDIRKSCSQSRSVVPPISLGT